jgi:hypothetical protein
MSHKKVDKLTVFRDFLRAQSEIELVGESRAPPHTAKILRHMFVNDVHFNVGYIDGNTGKRKVMEGNILNLIPKRFEPVRMFSYTLSFGEEEINVCVAQFMETLPHMPTGKIQQIWLNIFSDARDAREISK